MQNNKWMTDITVQLKRWLPAEVLSTQMHVGALPFFPVAVFELARWYFGDYFAQERRGNTEEYHLVAKVLGPSYISGCAQWGDIKDDEMLIHSARMWVATKVVDFIQQFRTSGKALA